MTIDFYKNMINKQVNNLDELRIVFRFAACDLQLESDEYKKVCAMVSKKEADILGAMVLESVTT